MCMYVCLYIDVYIHTHTHTHLCACVCVCVRNRAISLVLFAFISPKTVHIYVLLISLTTLGLSALSTGLRVPQELRASHGACDVRL